MTSRATAEGSKDPESWLPLTIFFFFFLEARDLERALEAAVTFRAIKQQ